MCTKSNYLLFTSMCKNYLINYKRQQLAVFHSLEGFLYESAKRNFESYTMKFQICHNTIIYSIT